MRKFKVTIGILILISIVWGMSYIVIRNKMTILPNAKLDRIKNESGLYWNLKVYSYNQLKIDSTFFTFPKAYCVSEKLDVMPWVSIYDLDYDSYDRLMGWINVDYPTLILIDQINDKREIYISGLYTEEKIGSRTNLIKRFERAIFLDTANHLLYDFRYVGGERFLF